MNKQLKSVITLIGCILLTSCAKEIIREPCFQYEDSIVGMAKFCVGEPETSTLEDLNELEVKIVSQGINMQKIDKSK